MRFLLHFVWLPLGGLVQAGTLSAPAINAIPLVEARVGDPFHQCEAISDSLPRTLGELRKRGTVISQRISSDTAEYCDATKHKCRRVNLKMAGLDIDLIDVTSKRTLSPLGISITSGKWRLMKGVHVGQSVEEIGAHYGVAAPPNEGEFAICGEAACLEIQHREQRVIRLRLDCQSSI